MSNLNKGSFVATYIRWTGLTVSVPPSYRFFYKVLNKQTNKDAIYIGVNAECVEEAKALFSSEKILDFATVVLSFLFNKYYPIMN